MSKIENSFNGLGIRGDLFSLESETREAVKDVVNFDIQRRNLKGVVLNQAYFPSPSQNSAFKDLLELDTRKQESLIGKSDEYQETFKKVDDWYKEGKRIRKTFFLTKVLKSGKNEIENESSKRINL